MFKNFRKRKSYVCLVCGYSHLSRPLYNKKGTPNIGLICSCCGFQPKYDEMELGMTIDEYREYWLQGGNIWFEDRAKPKDWDLKQQLNNINLEE
ncbi:hypothetical protein [Priestia megaterium]|uniref:hypothetical protein n=1 Tax=Priestia megaterium TaxID=1404 RepID=UPI00203B3475|nr:hypothetical protein [Priestia megaterium]MCM3196553.1 hypothetical protein [Priestia megaterium]